MSRLRGRLVLGLVMLSAVMAYFLRDVIYQVVVVPLAYAWWALSYYYSAIPQWAIWIVLLGILFIIMLWNLVPDGRGSPRKLLPVPRREGQVEALARGIAKARRGNYFKWQLANRMGRIVRRFDELSGSRARSTSGDDSIEKYLDAGLNYSFVDFLAPRGWFARAPRTPLDIDPRLVADYLESLMEKRSDRRG